MDDCFKNDRQTRMDTYKMLEDDSTALKKYEIKEVKDVTEKKATVVTVIVFKDDRVGQRPMNLVKKEGSWELHISGRNANDDKDFKTIKQTDGI